MDCIDINHCKLCGAVTNTKYTLSVLDGADRTDLYLCSSCISHIGSHARNYTLIHGSIMNKRWLNNFNIYVNNMRKRNAEYKSMSREEIEVKFWVERLAMAIIKSAKRDAYVVKLFIDKWLKDKSIEEIMNLCSKLFKDPDDWNDLVKVGMSRKDREKLLGEWKEQV